MAVSSSQNGWPVDPPRRSRLVPGTADVRVTVADGPAGDVLIHVLAQVHARVESLELDGARGELDDWGYAARPIRGSTVTSNHASATAVDVNATRHLLGAVGTFSPAQVAEIHRILGEVDHVVRWGGDYSGRKDEMHFEINAGRAAVERVAARLKEVDDMAGEGLNIERILTGANAPSMAQLKLDKDGRVVVPPGMTKDGLAYRVADIQWAMTQMLPAILDAVQELRDEVAALKGGQQ